MHRPKVLFLDEPSTGLDPQNRAHVWEQIKKLQTVKKTKGVMKVKDNTLESQISSKSVKLKGKPRQPTKYMQALKMMNQDKPSWTVPRKDTKDYRKLQKIMKTL